MPRLPIAVSALTLLLCASPALRSEDASTPAPQQEAAKKKEKAKSGKFGMGEVTVPVTDKLDPLETANTVVTAEAIQQLNRDDISTVLALLPGVSLNAGGARNETQFYLRGNDPRQTPVFVDGLPCYIPYDGNIDYSRFTTFDVAGIQVAKGFSSITYGANTLGGAINVVTRKPMAAFEGDVRVGAFEGNGKTASVNFGTNQSLYYVQGSASKTESDYWRMSSHYVPTALEDGGHRNNSYSNDKKLAVKFGLTPNATDEYVIGFSRQRGEKGDPNETDTSARYWRWPFWNMDSNYLMTNTAIGDKSYFKFKAYFNRYENSISSYTDGTYSTLKTSGSAAMSPYGHSYYKDFSTGLMFEYGTQALRNHSIKAIVQTKTDVHREGNDIYADTAQWAHDEDKYVILGVEDSITLSNTVDLSLGAGYDKQKPEAASAAGSSTSSPITYYTVPNAKGFFHGQAGIFWKVTPDTQLYATIAQKDHFATLKDRYSVKTPSGYVYIVNPDLKSETSLNYEVGVKSHLRPWLELQADLFESDITDLIQSVKTTLVDASSGSPIYQDQNIGKVVHKGAELALGFKPNRYVQGSFGYTYLDRTNKSSSTVLTGTPKNRVTGSLQVSPMEVLYFQASVQSQGRQPVTTTPTYVGGFTTVDLAVGWKPLNALSLDAGLKNATDKNYQYTTGFPMPGRTWFANARYTF
nr:TonB-dependent receptor [uncultured Holophaga sp.]